LPRWIKERLGKRSLAGKGHILDPEANNGLDEIWEYIAEDSHDAADRVREEIYHAIRDLVQFPHQGHRRTDLTGQLLRFWRVRFLIVYAPDEKPLLVVAVMHGRRSPRSMAAILRGREQRPPAKLQ
jgi:plasmid stabilization system protein ParE